MKCWLAKNCSLARIPAVYKFGIGIGWGKRNIKRLAVAFWKEQTFINTNSAHTCLLGSAPKTKHLLGANSEREREFQSLSIPL